MNIITHDGNGNILEEIIDNGDGSGVKKILEDNQVVSEVEVELPVPDEAEVKRQQAIEVVEQAKQSDNPEIAELANALSELI